MPETDLERARRLLAQAARLEERMYHLHGSQSHQLVIRNTGRIYRLVRVRLARRWQAVRRLERKAREGRERGTE